MREQIEQVRYPFLVASWTYGVVGLSGLALASVGLAGVTAYSVARRRREIGIRMALGARAGNVLRVVMAEALGLIALGTVVGGAVAYAGSKSMSAIMAEAGKSIGSAPGWLSIAAGAAVLAAVAALACYLPARRATRIDPAAVLRSE